MNNKEFIDETKEYMLDYISYMNKKEKLTEIFKNVEIKIDEATEL